MSTNPQVSDGRQVCAETTTSIKPFTKRKSSRKKPKPVKAGGLTAIGDVVIPKKDDSRPPGLFLSMSMALLRCRDVSSSDKLVLGVIMDMLGKNDRAWPSTAKIADSIGMSESAVGGAVERLEKGGFLIVDEGGGRKRSNRYYVTQLAFPCRLNPAVLCDRTSCPGDCEWSEGSVEAGANLPEEVRLPGGCGPEEGETHRNPVSLESEARNENSPDLGQFSSETDRISVSLESEVRDANSPDLGEFSSETDRISVSLDPETDRDSVRNQGTNNTEPKKGEGKEPPAASGGGGDARPPSSFGETPGNGVEDIPDHQKFKDWFCQRYEGAFGKPYRWQAKDNAILTRILSDGFNLDQVRGATEAMYQDPWALEGPKLSMGILSSKFNQYLPASGPQGLAAIPADAGYSWDRRAVEVHTLPTADEAPAEWPWPPRHTVRKDEDIPIDKQHRQMVEFSAEIIRQASTWFSSPTSWALTLTGPPGNGKSTVAAALLQSWRDTVYPNDEWQVNSRFVPFESFVRNVILEGTNPTSGWVDKPQIDRVVLNDLAGKQMLVLDDLCNRNMSGLQTDALHELLRTRESRGHKTIITTNRPVAELGHILGASVADRLAGGVILRFADDSLRGRLNSPPMGLAVPEGEDLARAATASLKAMQLYILHGPGIFARPRSYDNGPTFYDQNNGTNRTIESISGAYWYHLSSKLDQNREPLVMPDWDRLFQAVQALVDTLGNPGDADFYLKQLTFLHWHSAVAAVEKHAQAPGQAAPPLEELFLHPVVVDMMSSVLAGITERQERRSA